ncbi:thiamine-phosphate kinase [Afifella sp. YEN Y35]|uniref:thiamine-phosphate kinase n=1 Tax=Afifella sp. YEN Y35 TaxID=3388337 RepID=UPI0039E18E93
MDELELIDRFFRPLAGEGALGLLDDAGFVSPSSDRDLVVTKDMIAEGVHFLPGDPPETVARKALRVNLSDLAAKGAKPRGYLLALAQAPHCDEPWLKAFCEGLAGDQERYRIALIGGDTIASPDRITVSITAIGTLPTGTMVHRSGAKPGDILYLSGTIGGSGAGLAVLQDRAEAELAADDRDRLVLRYREPEPRTGLAEAVRRHASAALDISDGLAGDADKLASASGIRAVIEGLNVPLDPALSQLFGHGFSLEEALTGGDDYEILAAIPPGEEGAFKEAAAGADIPVTAIGHVEAGGDRAVILKDGKEMAFSRRSFVHGSH